MTQENEIYFIYKLIDPITNEIRYVGKTKDIEDRYKRHMQNCYLNQYDKNTHKSRWIKQLIRQGLSPIIEVIEECHKLNVNDREIFWIKSLKEQNHPLTNLSLGGEVGVDWNGRKHTTEAINKIKKSKEKYKMPVIQYTLSGEMIAEFESLMDAADKSGHHIHLISRCCHQKKYNTVGAKRFWSDKNNIEKASTFRFKGDKFDYTPYNKHIQINSKKVCKYDLNGKLVSIFDSIRSASVDSNQNKSNKSNITSCCRKKINKRTGEFIKVGNFTYRYYDETNGLDITQS